MRQSYAKEIEVQQYDTSIEKWKTVPLKTVVNNDDKIVVAPSFRVIVGERVIYSEFGFNAIKPRLEVVA